MQAGAAYSMLPRTGTIAAQVKMYRVNTYLGLVIAAMGIVPILHAVCNPPQALQAKIQAQKPQADAYAELGTWYGDRGQYGCAAEAFRAGLKLEPQSSQLLYLMGLNLLRSGDTEEAVHPLQRSIQLMPSVLKPHLLLADALEQLQRKDEARVEWLAALQVDPRSTIALNGLSQNLLAQGDYVSVIHLIGTSPTEESLIIDLAQAYEQAGMTDRATEILRQAQTNKPDSVELTNALVTVLVTQTHFEDAAKLAAREVELRPDDLAAKKLYLHVLVLNDDVRLARPLAKKLLTSAPHDFEVLYLNGVLEREGGEYVAARDHLQEAIAINPNHYNSHYNLGVVLAQLQDPKGAQQELEKAISLGATEPEIRFELAKVLRTLGETNEANEQLKLYQQEQQAKANRTLAASKAAQADKESDPQKTVSLYRDAVAAMPQNAMLQLKLGLALDRVGDTSSERNALEKAVELDPRMAIAHHQLGYLDSRGGDMAGAEQQFREAVGAAPGYIEAWVSLAATLGMESRFPEAQKALESALQLDPKNTEALQLRKDLATAAAQAAP